MHELLVIAVVLGTICLGLGWECEKCSSPTGLLWPRPRSFCEREHEGPR